MQGSVFHFLHLVLLVHCVWMDGLADNRELAAQTCLTFPLTKSSEVCKEYLWTLYRKALWFVAHDLQYLTAQEILFRTRQLKGFFTIPCRTVFLSTSEGPKWQFSFYLSFVFYPLFQIWCHPQQILQFISCVALQREEVPTFQMNTHLSWCPIPVSEEKKMGIFCYSSWIAKASEQAPEISPTPDHPDRLC